MLMHLKLFLSIDIMIQFVLLILSVIYLSFILSSRQLFRIIQIDILNKNKLVNLFSFFFL